MSSEATISSAMRATSASSASTQRTRLSLRHQVRWRFAYRRVAVFDLLDSLVERAFAAQRGHDFLVSDRLARRQRIFEPMGGERAHLVEQALLDHGIDPALDALVQYGRVDGQAEEDGGHRLRHMREAFVLTGVGGVFQLDHLERADDAARVVGMDQRRAFGVAALEHVPQLLRALLFEHARVVVAHGISGLFSTRKAIVVDRRTHVKPRAARQHAATPFGIERAEARTGVILEQRRRIRLARLADIESEMLDAALVGRDLARADIHTAIDLHRIGRNDRAADASGHFLGHIGLARGRRPHHADHRMRQGHLEFGRCRRLGLPGAANHRRPFPTDTRHAPGRCEP